MRIGDTLKKAAGLLIEFPEEENSSADLSDFASADPAARPAPVQKTVEQIVREAPGPNLDQISVPTAAVQPTEPVIAADGKVNYPSIYKLASLPDTPFTAEQVLEVLGSLPAELPLDAKRATLKVTLNAMGKANGVSPESVVADASRKLAALASYAHSFAQQADDYVKAAEAEIARLEADIQKRKAGIADAQNKQAQMIQACQTESDRLDDVLEFFSLDVPPSKYAPEAPKA